MHQAMVVLAVNKNSNILLEIGWGSVHSRTALIWLGVWPLQPEAALTA